MRLELRDAGFSVGEGAVPLPLPSSTWPSFFRVLWACVCAAADSGKCLAYTAIYALVASMYGCRSSSTVPLLLIGNFSTPTPTFSFAFLSSYSIGLFEIFHSKRIKYTWQIARCLFCESSKSKNGIFCTRTQSFGSPHLYRLLPLQRLMDFGQNLRRDC